MTDYPQTTAASLPPPDALSAVETAKARLLDWADVTDARTRKSWASVRTIASGAAVAVVGGIVISRLLSPRQPAEPLDPSAQVDKARWLRWPMLLRAGTWLLPYAVAAIKGKADKSPSAPKS